MKQTVELRINYDFAHLLFRADEGKNIGTIVRVVEISTGDPRYNQIPIVDKQVEEKYNKGFCYSWEFKRIYSKKELEMAVLFHIKIKTAFEPTGEERGTIYDETTACEICGANRKQLSPLVLKGGSIPKKDISRTIAGEVVVSEKFVGTFKRESKKGAFFEPVLFEKIISNYFQLCTVEELELSSNTISGADPWDFSEGSNGGTYNISGYEIKFGKEVYRCPKGHTIGLNLLSEPYVLDSPSINSYDFFTSKQKVGVKRGLLRPETIYLCSPSFRKMVIAEKLTGFDFEIAHVQ